MTHAKISGSPDVRNAAIPLVRLVVRTIGSERQHSEATSRGDPALLPYPAAAHGAPGRTNPKTPSNDGVHGVRALGYPHRGAQAPCHRGQVSSRDALQGVRRDRCRRGQGPRLPFRRHRRPGRAQAVPPSERPRECSPLPPRRRDRWPASRAAQFEAMPRTKPNHVLRYLPSELPLTRPPLSPPPTFPLRIPRSVAA